MNAKSAPQPVTMLMVSPEQLSQMIESAIVRAKAFRDEEVLDLSEAAKLLRIDQKTLRRKIVRGDIRPLPGKPYRFTRSSLEGR